LTALLKTISVAVIFSVPVQTSRGAHIPSCIVGSRVSFPDVNRLGPSVGYLSPSDTEVKKKSTTLPQISLWAIMNCYRVKNTLLCTFLYRPFGARCVHK